MAIHGGAGTLLPHEMTPEKEGAFLSALSEALQAGYMLLTAGGTALDAVEAAVRVMEDNPLFNAGKGAVKNDLGQYELDAAIMCGSTGRAGAVASLQGAANPITVARLVMDRSPHVILVGQGAKDFALANGLELKPDAYFHDDFRHQQWEKARAENLIILDNSYAQKIGTVGAVALDLHGNLAAATSTGGMTNKYRGRVGDSPLIGAGTFANRQVAVSCTGHGEYFIRNVVAYDLACLMEYKGLNLQEAADWLVMDKLKTRKAEGGLIAVDAEGQIAMPFNSPGMYRAAIDAEGTVLKGIFHT